MKWIAWWTLVFSVLGVGNVMAVEEAKYAVVLTEQSFEVRQYEPHVIAETIVDGDLETAGSKAFKRLFDYISGDNKKRQSVAMTAPVSQGAASEKIDMTSPVGQQRNNDKWAVSFMMPSSYSLEALPQPNNPSVSLRQVPERYIAVVRYSGFWSEKAYTLNLKKLESWVVKQQMNAVGEPIWAKYNPPFMPWFLRRNEILIPIEWPLNLLPASRD